jgi:hypothetical protein
MSRDRTSEAWLRRLKWALAEIPSPEREDILAEARSHIEDRVAAGRPPAEVVAEFGPADAYARDFIDEMETTGALGAQRSGDLLGVVVRRVHRSLAAALALFAVLLLGLVAFSMMIMVWLKVTDPAHAGLWIGPHEQFIGVIDDPSKARDVLGLWLYPLAALVLLLGWTIGRAILIWAVRTLRPRI